MPNATPKSDNELPSYPAVEMVINAIADWINRYRRSAGSGGDLRHCDPAEVTRMAADLGVTTDQLRDLAKKGPGSADLLQKMLVALDVDAKAIVNTDPLVMRDLQRLCVMCGNKKRCEHDLAAGRAPGHFHEFCPNAYTLDALLDEKRAAS